MCPQLATRARTSGQVQHALAGEKLHASYRSTCTKYEFSHVRRLDRVSLNGGKGSILGICKIATRRLDARAASIGPGRLVRNRLNCEVQDAASPITRWLRTSWLQRSNMLVSRFFIKIKDFIKQSKSISEEHASQYIKPCLIHQPDAKQHCSMELRAAQRNNEPTLVMRERENLFKIGIEAQAAPRHQRAHVLTEQHQLVLVGDAQR